VSEAIAEVIADLALRSDVTLHHEKLVVATANGDAKRAASLTSQDLEATARRLWDARPATAHRKVVTDHADRLLVGPPYQTRRGR
jgi:DNA-binding GntR family transcriptional regulator